MSRTLREIGEGRPFTDDEKLFVIRQVVAEGAIAPALRGLSDAPKQNLIPRVPDKRSVIRWLADNDPEWQTLIKSQRIDLAQRYYENAKAFNEEVYQKAGDSPLNMAIFGAWRMGDSFVKMITGEGTEGGQGVHINVTFRVGPRPEIIEGEIVERS